jgi:Tol biopolymer transport system component
VEKTSVWVGDLGSKARRQVLAANSNTVYSPPGYLLFLREQTLMAQPFDAGKLLAFGEPVSIAERVDYVTVQIQGQFSASGNGDLTYLSGASAGSRQLTWFDRAGRVSGTVGPATGIAASARISPDGKTVVVARGDPETGSDLWLHDLERATAIRFTFTGYNTDPVWSADGSRVAFASVRNGVRNLYQRGTGGVANDEIRDKTLTFAGVSDWSPDGRYLVATAFDPKTKVDLWALPVFGDRKPLPYLHSEFTEQSARVSPNGQLLAYVSNESKRNEVYVQSFPNPAAKWQISTEGGTTPVWSRDGKELFFVGANQRMMSVEVKEGAKFEAGVPKPLFDIRSDIPGFDVSAVGRSLSPCRPSRPPRCR